MRTTNYSTTLNPSAGFGLGGFDLEMDFSLNQTKIYIGGSVISTVTNPGGSDFFSLYDEWKIDMVEVATMIGFDNIVPGVLSTPQLPIFNYAFDPSDTSTITLGSILQFENVQTVQMGVQRGQDGFVVRFKPVPGLPIVNTGGSVTFGTVPEKAGWMSMDLTTTPHNALKIVYDPAASTNNSIIGSVTFYIKYHFSMKLSH